MALAGGGGDGDAGPAAAVVAAPAPAPGAPASDSKDPEIMAPNRAFVSVEAPPAEADVAGLAGKYTGRSLVQRLEFLALVCPPLRREAIERAHDAVKSAGQDTAKYSQLCAAYPDILSGARALQAPWVAEVDAAAATRQAVLERDLNTHLANQSRFHIRRGNVDLARFYHERGNLPQAMACYNRAFDYSTPQEKAEHFVTVAQLALEEENWAQLGVSLRKLHAFPADATLTAKARAMEGLLRLHEGEYKRAASAFTDVSGDALGLFADVVLPEDVALYGGLCALASFSRHELLTKVLENKAFQPMLELTPLLKEAVTAFHASRYSTCLNCLHKLQASAQLDMYMNMHVGAILRRIKNRGILQYFRPYSAVELVRMAKSFNTSVDALIEDVSLLIMQGEMQARIDSHNKILVSRSTDLRVDAFANALTIGRQFARRTEALMLRMSMMQHNVVVKIDRRRAKKPGVAVAQDGTASAGAGASAGVGAAGGAGVVDSAAGPSDGAAGVAPAADANDPAAAAATTTGSDLPML